MPGAFGNLESQMVMNSLWVLGTFARAANTLTAELALQHSALPFLQWLGFKLWLLCLQSKCCHPLNVFPALFFETGLCNAAQTL